MCGVKKGSKISFDYSIVRTRIRARARAAYDEILFIFFFFNLLISGEKVGR